MVSPSRPIPFPVLFLTTNHVLGELRHRQRTNFSPVIFRAPRVLEPEFSGSVCDLFRHVRWSYPPRQDTLVIGNILGPACVVGQRADVVAMGWPREPTVHALVSSAPDGY